MRSNEIWLILFAGLCIFIYSGAFYGWGPMQLLLEENGNLNDECEPDAGVCEEQTAALLDLRFYSQFAILATPLFGWISDRYGVVSVVFAMGLQAVVGSLCLYFGAKNPGGMDWILYPGFVLLGLVAANGGLLTLGLAMLFTGVHRNRIILVLNSVYDSGAVTFLILRKLGLVLEATLPHLALSYLVGALVCYGGLLLCLKWILAVRSAASCVEQIPTGNNAYSKDESTPEELETKPTALDDEKRDPPLDEVGSTPSGQHSPPAVEDYTVIATRPVAKQLLSTPFVLLSLFFSFQTLSNVWTLTSARDFLKNLGDDDFDNRYLTIFTLMTPVSLIAVPFVDVAINRYGFHAALQTVNALGVLNGIVKIATRNLNVQIVGFVIFTFYRGFLFAVAFAVLPSFLSPNALGRAVGVYSVGSGVVSFLAIPLAALAVKEKDGDFFLSNTIMLALNAPIIGVIWVCGKHLHRDAEMVKKQKDAGTDQENTLVAH